MQDGPGQTVPIRRRLFENSRGLLQHTPVPQTGRYPRCCRRCEEHRNYGEYRGDPPRTEQRAAPLFAHDLAPAVKERHVRRLLRAEIDHVFRRVDSRQCDGVRFAETECRDGGAEALEGDARENDLERREERGGEDERGERRGEDDGVVVSVARGGIDAEGEELAENEDYGGDEGEDDRAERDSGGEVEA